jgi:hypothetical protein
MTRHRHVTIIPTIQGPTAGYQAALVTEFECEWTGETVRDVLRYGPFCDAELIARSRAIDWALAIGERVDPTI